MTQAPASTVAEIQLRRFDNFSPEDIDRVVESAQITHIQLGKGSFARSAEVRHGPKISGRFAGERFDRLLTAFVSALSPEPSESCFPVSHRHQRLVRIAQEYIDAHMAETVRIKDLCVMLGASYKTLERAFISVLGVAPRHFLSVARLSRARRLLLNGSRELTRIADIALRCGYDQFGRFSADYRQRFGEPPSRTSSQSVSSTASR